MKNLTIHLSTSYPIYIDHNLLETKLLKEYTEKLQKRLVIIADRAVESLANKLQKSLRSELLFYAGGETHKTRETKQQLEDELLKRNYGRDTCLIALGGGVLTDLVGFLAATYCRGIPVIYLPTTLLAMVDASIGGKTAVNTAYGKNLIGAISQPHAVFIDTHTLKSLPPKEWCNGMVEVIKHSLIADEKLFEYLLQNAHQIHQYHPEFLINLIYANCLIKKNIVEQDELDHGIRQILNFGHTIGHVIETIMQYHISHGEAVAIGMLVETYLSAQCGVLQKDIFPLLQKILRLYGLPLKTTAFQQKQLFQQNLMLDKKAKNNIPPFVLLENIGQVHHSPNYVTTVDPLKINQTLEWAERFFAFSA